MSTCYFLCATEKRKAEAGGGEGEEGEEALRIELEAAEFERAKVGAGVGTVGLGRSQGKLCSVPMLPNCALPNNTCVSIDPRRSG